MLTDHISKFAKRGKREMCSFGSCQTRLEFLSQFRKVRNAFECFITQVQTHLPKTKRVWPMKINVICTVFWYTCILNANVDVSDVFINKALYSYVEDTASFRSMHQHCTETVNELACSRLTGYCWSMTFSSFTCDGLIFTLDVFIQFFKQLELHLNYSFLAAIMSV